MNQKAPTQAVGRTPRLVLGSAAVAIAVAIGTIGFPSVSSSATSFREVLRGDHRGALGEADGVVLDGTSVLDDSTPAVAELDPSLREALRRAAAGAAEDGVELFVNSGWRSPAYQERLLQDAIAQHGSREEAARWVATPSTSPHVSGDAVDIGHADGAQWLSERGAAYGICQVYDNEPWHYELRPEAVSQGCPPTYADPTHDPRMQR
jgi:D-alanyl-D-alanine carboxypeptidase